MVKTNQHRFKTALLSIINSIILGHNHPSDNVTYSTEYINIPNV
ncbi:JAB domain-containing protein [Staphylococcus casei]